MRKHLAAIAGAVLTVAFGSAPRSNAGTDMVIDNSAQAPPPRYNYGPPPPVYYAPPPVVYYAPPPVRVVVAPTYGYYARPARVIGYHRAYSHRGFWHGR